MPRLAANPILLFLIHLTQSALLRQIAYLRAENRILRSRITGAVRVTPAERTILLRLGRCLGISLPDLISIVHYKTFLGWVRTERKTSSTRRAPTRGRPVTQSAVAEIILRMARENAWGSSRIQGELLKLGIVVARNTVKNILIKNGFHPTPGKHAGDWNRFLTRHMQTLWACDFFTQDIWTAFGKATVYVLFFIHLGTRRVHLAGATCNPTGAWTEQQCRNFVADVADRGESISYLIRDGDGKFTAAFDEITRSEGGKVKRLPPESPNLNAFAERFVQTIRNECLDHFVVFGERHLEHLLGEYASFYNSVRPHQGRANHPIGVIPFPATTGPPDPGKIGCESRLGGLLRHYHRKAA